MNRKLIYVLIAGVAALAIWKLVPSDSKAGSASGGEPMIAVTVPTLTSAGEEGKVLFDKNCAECHGKDAAGVKGKGPTFMHKVYVAGHHGDGAFLIAAKNGVRQHHWPFGNMPPVEGIKDEEVAKIVVYVRELQKANGL